MGDEEPERAQATVKLSASETLRHIAGVARWIVRSPVVWVLILATLFFDGIVRMFVTLASEYLRVIQYPAAALGVITAGISLNGMLMGKLGFYLVNHKTMGFNLLFLGLWIGGALMGMSLGLDYWGLCFVVMLFASMTLIYFFASHYLNENVDSERRATVLSFKSLSANLCYGLLGLRMPFGRIACVLKMLSGSKRPCLSSLYLAFLLCTGVRVFYCGCIVVSC